MGNETIASLLETTKWVSLVALGVLGILWMCAVVYVTYWMAGRAPESFGNVILAVLGGALILGVVVLVAHGGRLMFRRLTSDVRD